MYSTSYIPRLLVHFWLILWAVTRANRAIPAPDNPEGGGKGYRTGVSSRLTRLVSSSCHHVGSCDKGLLLHPQGG